MFTLVVLLATSQAPAPAAVSTFRTDAAPRVDPVFGDAVALRASIEKFLALEAEMEAVRSEFSTAVHDTLALLPSAQPAPVKGPRTKSCPASTSQSYARAREAGARYLGLGRKLEAAFRDIRRGDDLGDTLGLTPDYRWKVKRARELYSQLVRDLREMRVAFHDQLGAELTFAGCRFATTAGSAPTLTGPPVDPSNPAAWDLAAADAPLPSSDAKPPAVAAVHAAPVDNDAPVARAIWIDVDNSNCGQTSRLLIDGAAYGDVPAGKKSSVRTKAGPREVCLLPAGDKRTCGAPGTLRRTYFYEGLTLTVHCPR